MATRRVEVARRFRLTVSRSSVTRAVPKFLGASHGYFARPFRQSLTRIQRRQFDSETFGFYQTYLNVPVWRAGLKVTVKQGPNRVVSSEDTTRLAWTPRCLPRTPSRATEAVFTNSNTVTVQRRALQAQTDLRAAVKPQGPRGQKAKPSAKGKPCPRAALIQEGRRRNAKRAAYPGTLLDIPVRRSRATAGG